MRKITRPKGAALPSATPGPAARRGLQPSRSLGKVVEGPLRDFVTKIVDKGSRLPRGLRNDGYLHVSDLVSRCIRKMALVQATGTRVRPEYLSSSDRFTFAQGEAIHDTAREMICSGEPDMAYGKWRCKCGFLTHNDPCCYSEIDTDDVCEYCFTAPTEYVEVDLIDEEWNLIGHPDLLLKQWKTNSFHVVEIKSIQPDAFKELTAAKPDHIIQVMLYWQMLRRAGMAVTDRVSVLYVSKGYQFSGRPYKEFTLDANEEADRTTPYIAEATHLANYKRTGRLPTRIVCKSAVTATARQCEVCKDCFAPV